MKLVISFLALAVLLGLLHVARLVVAADGWLAGGVFVLGALFLLGLFGMLFTTLSRLFTRRPGG